MEDFDGDFDDIYEHLLYVTGSPVMKWKEIGFKKVSKLGEGAYGEVFATNYGSLKTAVKVSFIFSHF